MRRINVRKENKNKIKTDVSYELKAVVGGSCAYSYCGFFCREL